MCAAGEDSKWVVVENGGKKESERTRENTLPKDNEQKKEPCAF